MIVPAGAEGVGEAEGVVIEVGDGEIGREVFEVSLVLESVEWLFGVSDHVWTYMLIAVLTVLNRGNVTVVVVTVVKYKGVLLEVTFAIISGLDDTVTITVVKLKGLMVVARESWRGRRLVISKIKWVAI
jgi:hypothetical protein